MSNPISTHYRNAAWKPIKKGRAPVKYSAPRKIFDISKVCGDSCVHEVGLLCDDDGYSIVSMQKDEIIKKLKELGFQVPKHFTSKNPKGVKDKLPYFFDEVVTPKKLTIDFQCWAKNKCSHYVYPDGGFLYMEAPMIRFMLGKGSFIVPDHFIES